MNAITEQLQTDFEKIHAKIKTPSVIHLKELKQEITNWQQNGLITKKFYKQNYGQFVFHPSKTFQKARSIIIIGIPQAITPVEFFHDGKQYQTILPPTYLYTQVRATCQKILSGVLGKHGYSIELAILPMKLLAVRSGLGKYGKNNLCYVDGMGSLTRLQAFYTDYEFPTDDWVEKEMMDACTHCTLCQHACPTQCIPHDRFLIHADHCLTYFTEYGEDFPSWIPSQAHNAIVGCLHCQLICPQNKKFLTYDGKTLHFTEEETSIILQKTPKDRIPPALAKKLIDFDIDEYYPELPRNLSVLIKK